jgi:DNA-binding NarL/FixJ family response regulator
LANGKPTHEIAGYLGVNQGEVERWLTGLFAKMGAGSRTEAIAAGFRRGLLIREEAL